VIEIFDNILIIPIHFVIASKANRKVNVFFADYPLGINCK
jgi:hypothetical protein